VVFCVVFGDDEDVEPAERLRVRGEGAVGCGDEDAAQLFAVAGADLDHMRARRRGRRGRRADQVEPGGEVEVEAAERNGVEIGQRASWKPWTAAWPGRRR
jgi:hypothetical protein